jgi:CheY-like chemotaxis protein
MSRLEAGGLVPEPRDFPLAEVLEPLVSEFRALAGERGLSFSYVPTRMWVHTDPQLLRRILQNFLANAIRYTQTGGILFGVRRVAGDVRIEVHDSGPGIELADQQVIFEEFRRGDDASGQGLGLGLSIADRIAHLLKAPLSLRSRFGHGAMFAVTLARVQPSRAEASTTFAKQGLVGRQVLALDNDATSLEALRRVLAGWGCHVLLARDGDEAMQRSAEAEVDLWLFDFHLDQGDTGVAVTQRLAQRFGARPCLILSADLTETVRAAVHEAGLLLLAKPVRPLALKSVLDRMIASSGMPVS